MTDSLTIWFHRSSAKLTELIGIMSGGEPIIATFDHPYTPKELAAILRILEVLNREDREQYLASRLRRDVPI